MIVTWEQVCLEVWELITMTHAVCLSHVVKDPVPSGVCSTVYQSQLFNSQRH